MLRELRKRLSREEDGGVIVTVAIAIPTLIVIAVLVVDVVNWYVHKHHLQQQSDAAALAAAQDVTFNGQTGACSSTGYDTTAQNYGQSQYNAQIGGTPASEIHVGLGKASWFGQTDGTVVPGDPCVSSMIDVKTAETNLPFLFGSTFPGLDIVPHIGSHARVEFKKENTDTGDSPIAVRATQVLPYPRQTILKLSGGSQTQAVDCDPNGLHKLDAELTSGCAPTYTTDPNATPQLSDCSGFNPSSTAQPWYCVALSTGNTAGQVQHGLNQRVYGNKNQNTCPSTGRNNFPTLTKGDPRIISVFITPYDFSQNGQIQGGIPITGFATFYLTGWEGDPCIGAPTNPDSDPGNGGIAGYFVRFNDTGGGGGGTAPCNLLNTTDLSTCVAVLTQ